MHLFHDTLTLAIDIPFPISCKYIMGSSVTAERIVNTWRKIERTLFFFCLRFGLTIYFWKNQVVFFMSWITMNFSNHQLFVPLSHSIQSQSIYLHLLVCFSSFYCLCLIVCITYSLNFVVFTMRWFIAHSYTLYTQPWMSSRIDTKKKTPS